jgi:hypothetical protein
MRKIIQIAATREVYPESGDMHDALFALANDGSMWALYNTEFAEDPENWKRLPDLPTDK